MAYRPAIAVMTTLTRIPRHRASICIFMSVRACRICRHAKEHNAERRNSSPCRETQGHTTPYVCGCAITVMQQGA